MDPKGWRVELNDGHLIPVLGFGTSALDEVPKSKTVEVTKLAIEAGFYHFDSAFIYNNEKEVGQAIQSKIEDGTVKREDIFYTSKLWLTFLRPELVQPALENSLRKLQLDYVDLYIIHYPMALKPGEEILPKDEHGKLTYDTVHLCATWEAMEKCKDAGLTKSIGVFEFQLSSEDMKVLDGLNRNFRYVTKSKTGKVTAVAIDVGFHHIDVVNLYQNEEEMVKALEEKMVVGIVKREDMLYITKVEKDSPYLLEEPILSAIAK
ncbi:hypothetical protein HPG69_008420 [Diceros bicornis minor]|uniref:NADP-dependent oxidoreductase domain-containing protein n=1 Tax=Diceros bicornis minor TaxID=77932 RepID=A0A7J7FKN2_DICBM|nr:hypothetical protein HPG69_008420 [Diceros bicornis minor]